MNPTGILVEEKHRIDLDDRRVLSLTVVRLDTGVTEPAHTHPGFEVLYGLSGHGHVELDGTVRKRISPGAVVAVAEGTVKAITNVSGYPLEVLAVLVLDRDRPPFLPTAPGPTRPS
jgi:quercetin dioxygenase-like cupin family protein